MDKSDIVNKTRLEEGDLVMVSKYSLHSPGDDENDDGVVWCSVCARPSIGLISFKSHKDLRQTASYVDQYPFPPL